MDEWSLEQGVLAVQNSPPHGLTLNRKDRSISKPPYLLDDGPQPEDNDRISAEEIPGWKGYIEWDKYPDKKRKAAEILARDRFPPPPESHSNRLRSPAQNPVLEGERCGMWHKAVGGALTNIPEGKLDQGD